MNESIQFLKSYCTFDNPKEIWLLKGITRNKDNKGNPDAERFMRRLVIAKPEDIEPCYNDIKRMGNALGTIYRVYVSLNSRDTVKGLFNFQKKLLEISYDVSRDLDDAIEITKKIGSKWKTELEQKSNRGTKRFLIDIDEDDVNLLSKVLHEARKLELQGLTTVHTHRKTVSGYAVVMDACDIRGFLDTFKDREVSIQKDSMLFVESWDGKERQ
jgi:hypothetical protein